jgi:hypothetical protein
MQAQQIQVRHALHRLLLDEDAGAAANLVPRMLADPDSLTPEIRWCLLYFIRGIGFLAARNRLLEFGDLLHTVVEGFEAARRKCERLDGLWFSVVREDEEHWIQRYEAHDTRYSLEELEWLRAQLDRLWRVERERLALEEPPLAPLALRSRLSGFAESESPAPRHSGPGFDALLPSGRARKLSTSSALPLDHSEPS